MRDMKRSGVTRNILDYVHGTFLTVRKSTLTGIAEATRKTRECCKKALDNGNIFPTISEKDMRVDGLEAVCRWCSGLQTGLHTLLQQLETKDRELARLKDSMKSMEDEIKTLRLEREQHDRQTHEHQALLETYQANSNVLEHLINNLIESLSQEALPLISPKSTSKEILTLTDAINTCLESIHARSEQAMHITQTQYQRLTTALKAIARGEIPETGLKGTTQMPEVSDCIYHASATLHEVYSGLSSVAETIQVSMELLFTIAEEIADGAAQQMAALQELEETARQMSQNTINMTDQTGATAKIAEEMQTLSGNVMMEVDAMLAAVSESSENIEDIREIMDQSSLLSLNARIIAAQTGDNGKAFSVVAEHMKELADQTDVSLQLITKRVNAIVECSDKVHDGVRKFVASMGTAKENSDQIASGTYEFSTSIQQLTASVESILSRAKHSAVLARKLTEQARSISIALRQLTVVQQLFEQQWDNEFEIYFSGDSQEHAGIIHGINSIEELRTKRLAAILINKGPVDWIVSHRMYEEAERQQLQLRLYNSGNNDQLSIRIAEKIIQEETADILFFQVSNNPTFHKILHLAKQHGIIVIPFCRGGNVSNVHVPFQILTQDYEEGKLAAGFVPENSRVFAILGPESVYNANVRAHGFFQNLPASAHCAGQVHGDWTEEEAMILMNSFLEEHGQDACDVIYGINDTTAMGAIRACFHEIIDELLCHNTVSWTAKTIIGTDATEEMLNCLNGTQGQHVLGRLLKSVVRRYDGRVTLTEDSDGWKLQWSRDHEALFRLRDGQIIMHTRHSTTTIINNMMTVSHSTFLDSSNTPIGAGATAIRHLIDCIERPGEPGYVVFSQEHPITTDTPAELISAVRYVMTEQQIQWIHDHVQTLDSHNNFTNVKVLT